ncbi:MAG: AAA family ATPase, partial [Prevotella sp.]|nr:AAA family ATPase [Prevotella sp.]
MTDYFTQNNGRRLPEGIQFFDMIRRGDYVYVDKTDLVWHLANGRMFNYLSRPRRFGKSLLVDTLRCYFEGRKELFEGLKIMELEKEWKPSPVIRLDMSNAGATPESLRSYLNSAFRRLEKKYGVETYNDDSLAVRFENILITTSNEGETPVAILIDEYDSPLQHSWHTPEHEACTAIYREVFAVLKSCMQYERFVFLTGITKFTQISLFSVLNNLTNISFMPQYATVCGITKQEIRDNFMPEIEAMANKNGWTVEQTFEKLKYNYDGYHFSKDKMVDVYNPYSLVIALAQGETGNYWASSGATTLLP